MNRTQARSLLFRAQCITLHLTTTILHHAQEAAAGSGATWLVVLAGLALGRLAQLSGKHHAHGASHLAWLLDGLAVGIGMCQEVRSCGSACARGSGGGWAACDPVHTADLCLTTATFNGGSPKCQGQPDCSTPLLSTSAGGG